MKKPGYQIEEVEIDPKLPEKIQDKVVKGEMESAKGGRRIGLGVIVLGVLLTILGATGAVDLRLQGLGLNAHVANAAPGVVLMLIGLFIIWLTRFTVKAAKPK